MKLKVAILGYGNLGRALKQKLEASPDFELVGVFSNRIIPGTIHISKIYDYKDKIDLLFICSGSKTNLESDGRNYIRDFNIIESYDNHNRLRQYIKEIDMLAKKHNKISLCSFGWDPGLFSYMRTLLSSLGLTPYTFWGKGLSQGHTQAIKNIEGVVDGLQFTVPSKIALNEIKNGNEKIDQKSMHERHCYIVANKQDKAQIKEKIISMPDYFLGYKTIVNFVSQERLDKLKNFAHKGTVLSSGNTVNFSLTLASNPDFTASVLVAYAKAVIKLTETKKYGAYTILDIPLSYLVNDKFEFL